MADYRTILAPTDFSRHAAVALGHACGLAERLGSELHLLHVLPDFVPASPDPIMVPAMSEEYFTQAEARAREALAAVLDPAWGRPPSVVIAVRWGPAVEGIVEYAREHAVDLLVIATHGRTGLPHMLLGSVAERLVREAPCPVLTVRERS